MNDEFLKRQNELLKRARDGDSRAREQLIEENIPIVKQTVYKLLKGKSKKTSKENKEDELQQAYLIAIKLIDKMIASDKDYTVKYLRMGIENKLNVWYWKTNYTVSYNIYKFENRTESVLNRINTVDVNDEKYKIQSEEDMETEVTNKILVENLLKELDDEERIIIKLMFFQNYKQAEIAETLGKTQSYVSKKYNKIIKKLREKMTDG